MKTPFCLDDEQLTGYALGALDPHEAEAAARHVPGCEVCRSAVERMNPALDLIAESVPRYEAPAPMRERLLDVVREEAVSAPAPSRPGFFARAGSFLLRPATALAAVAVIAAGAGGYALNSGDEARVVQVTTEFPGATAEIEIDEDVGTLTATGMPPLPEGEVYQVWVRSGQVTVPSGAFVPRGDGTATAAVELVENSAEMMVTREPHAGREDPTLPTLMQARLD